MLPINIYESWALYVIDTDNKHMMIMDPCETSEPKHEMEDKHAANAVKVLEGWFAPFMNASMGGMFCWLDGHSSTTWGRILAAQGKEK
jgi:hypothetical protein